MHELDKYIRSVKDFPQEGIIFRDITTVMQDPKGLQMAVECMADAIKDLDFDVIAGIEARGFIFGSMLAYKFNKGFVPIRKKGKLPFKTVSEEYELEYGMAAVEMHLDSIKKGQKVIVVDDLIATGGTVKAAINLIEKLGGKVESTLFLVELKGLDGRKALEGYDVRSVVAYEGK